MRVRRLFAVAFLLPLGCGKTPPGPAAGGGAAGEPGPVVVKVTSPKRQPLHWTIEQPGTLQPFEVTPLVAKFPGYVKAIAPDSAAGAGAVIDIGSAVKAGQTLATLDIPELVEEAAQKTALVEQAKAEWEQDRKDLAVAEAQLATAKAAVQEAEAGVQKALAEVDRWRSELAQSDDLVVRRVIDVQSRDVVKKQFQAAEAARAEAAARVSGASAALVEREARRDRAAAVIVTAAAKVKVAEAEARRVAALVGYATIKAPFDGIVTARNVHPGHFIQPSGPNRVESLFTVARIDPVRVFVDVPEVTADKARAGTAATVRVPALGNRDFAGTVTRTTGVIQPDSRTLRAEIDLPNPDGQLRPGMYAFVQIKAESADATVLPAAAILPADETHYCYVVEDGKALKLRVQTGRTEGTSVQVAGKRRATATAGTWEPFTGKEQVVVGSLGALNDGLPVQVAAP